jgi:hypothetical protein
MPRRVEAADARCGRPILITLTGVVLLALDFVGG